MKIILDWPNSKLSPNARTHWAAKANLKAAAREAAWVLTKQEMAEEGGINPKGEYRMDLTFCPPDKRRRDLDNIEAACKATFDGMCEALGIDDCQIKETVKRWGKVFKPGGIVVVELDLMD